MPPAVGALSDATIPASICLSVCLSHLGQLGTLRVGQATRAVQTVDPSAYGRRSAAIRGGGILSYCVITCLGLCFRSMSLRTLSMLGSRPSTPRYGTLNSSRDFHTGLAAESRTLDRSHSNTFDQRAHHAERSRNGSSGFERSAALENSRPRNFERVMDGEERYTPVTSPVSFQTFNIQQQQMAVRNGGTRDMHPMPKNSQGSLSYVDMNHRGTIFTCNYSFIILDGGLFCSKVLLPACPC